MSIFNNRIHIFLIIFILLFLKLILLYNDICSLYKMNYEQEQINNYKAQMRHLENIKFMLNHMQNNPKIYCGNTPKVKEEINKKQMKLKIY